MRKSYKYLLLLILLSDLNSIFCQTDENRDINQDSICYRYNFSKGDSLFYYVVSYDSIIIDFDKPLTKMRYERILITCDSVSSNEHYFLTQTLVEYMSAESKGDIKDVKRTDHPWVGRKVWYEIDALGNRHRWGYDDSTKGALCPGGGFQPYIILPIGESCKQMNESWNFNSLDAIPENGVPVPLLKQSSLFRARGYLDTLGLNCKNLEFIKTGQGNLEVQTQEQKMQVTNIMNGFGQMYFDASRNIPVHFSAKLEQKLKIKLMDSTEKTGKHFVDCTFNLEKDSSRIKH